MKFRETSLAALTGVASNLVARTGNEIAMLYMRDILYFSESSQPSIYANYFILFYFYSFKDHFFPSDDFCHKNILNN